MSDAVWWIEAQGRAWGPYPAARLAAFREEGRLGASSLVGRSREGPFAPAALDPGLRAVFDSAAAPAPEGPASRAVLVIAEPGDAAAAFETALGGRGEVVRIRPGLWLVRAREGAAALRNALSRRVAGGGMLLVVEAPLADAAWFNLDERTDAGLRRLWAAS